ncbi:transporter substrate-binding domain-containing protein [Phenylobacterium aquaticum]|uniref:transporter substrate-binding domain-containing protein n=1 Tax=Phenylobacterium aquaticum TaxID=1763816 RepID=UPI0026EEAE17|nr:transporter substrate-binding domain-containing protein [Phenylobacterium aquaticum]
MIYIIRLLALLTLFSSAFSSGALAAPQTVAAAQQNHGRILTVSVRVLPPFVEQKNGIFTGYSIDLWNAIAERQNWESRFRVASSVKGQLEDVASGAADVGVGAISITAERTMHYEFSQPIMNSGLQILVREERAPAESTALKSILKLLFSKAMLIWFGIAFLLSVIPAHVIWFFERNHNNGIIQSNSYFPGIFEALFWGLSSITGSADSMPRQWLARLFALFWTFASIVFVAFYTAQLTASLTVEKFRAEISGPQDLPGKNVGTLQGSTSAAFLQTTGAKVSVFPTIDDAYQALMNNSVDAVVYDAPVLQYMATRQRAGRVRTVGPIFHTEDYGHVFHDGSPLRRKVDATLLLLREDGTYDRLNEQYFGKK